MEKKYYMPRPYTQRLVWQQNFVSKLNSYAAALGIDAATLLMLANDLLVTIWIVQVVELFKQTTNERVKFKDVFFDGVDGTPMGGFPAMPTMPATPATLNTAGAFKRIEKIVQQIKTNKNYTELIGSDLGIIGAEQSVEWDTAYPIIEVVASVDSAKISFKKEHSDGIKIFSKRGTETDFSFLAVITHSPYHDNRPKLDAAKPETREYYAVFILHDEIVGLKSKTVSVVIA